MSDQAVDLEMLKWLDALVDIDPAQDIDVVELLEESDELAMYEADADGDLQEGQK